MCARRQRGGTPPCAPWPHARRRCSSPRHRCTTRRATSRRSARYFSATPPFASRSPRCSGTSYAGVPTTQATEWPIRACGRPRCSTCRTTSPCSSASRPCRHRSRPPTAASRRRCARSRSCAPGAPATPRSPRPRVGGSPRRMRSPPPSRAAATPRDGNCAPGSTPRERCSSRCRDSCSLLPSVAKTQVARPSGTPPCSPAFANMPRRWPISCARLPPRARVTRPAHATCSRSAHSTTSRRCWPSRTPRIPCGRSFASCARAPVSACSPASAPRSRAGRSREQRRWRDSRWNRRTMGVPGARCPSEIGSGFSSPPTC